MPVESIPFPNRLSGWNSFKPISDGFGWMRPYEYLFPEKYLPSDRFYFSDEFGNTSIMPIPYDPTIMGVQTLPIGAGLLTNVGVSVAASITLQRVGNSGSSSGGVPYIELQPSPRIGFSFGNYFKNQTYIRVDVVGFGEQILSGGIQWLMTQAIPSIETSSHCRLKKVHLEYGKLLGVRRDGDNYYLKIHDSDNPPGFQERSNTGIHVYNGRGLASWYPISKPINDSWEVAVSIHPVVTFDVITNNPVTETFDPANSMFFRLWDNFVIENPMLMHDYGLVLYPATTSGGWRIAYETSAQKRLMAKTTLRLVGVWLPPSETFQYYSLCIDKVDQALVPLPKSKSSSDRTDEAMQLGGSLQDGLDALKPVKNKLASLRICIDGVSGAKSAQNFCFGNLTGEWLALITPTIVHYYEIVGQPRNDTIEVGINSVDAGTNLLDELTPTCKVAVIQQKA